MKLKLKRFNEKAKLPMYATKGSAGFDLETVEPFSLEPFERKLVKTGWGVELPEGYEMQIRSRSGLALKNGIIVLNAPGTIDSDYRGEIGVILMNMSKNVYYFQQGDRIAQAIIAKVKQPKEIIEVEEMSDTKRGEGGFGSTGV